MSLSKDLPSSWSSFGAALSGGVGAAFALTATYPLDLAKTVLQVPVGNPDEKSEGEKRPTTMLEVIQRVYEKEGITGVYNGLPTGVLQVMANSFAYFYFYTFIRNHYLKRATPKVGEMHATLPAWAELSVGGVAGILAQLCTLPVSVAVTRQQTTLAEHRKSMIETWKDIIEEDGYSGLWRGLKPSLVLVINPSITYGVFEKCKGYWLNLKAKRDLTALEIFVIGAISKTIATIVTYPYIMAKVRLQWKAPKHVTDDPEYKPYKDSIDVLKRVLKNKGLIGWYEGMQAQISKAVLSQIILFLVKEKITFSVTMLLLGLRKLIAKNNQTSAIVQKN
ncbi:mitochondrial carrier [Neoconidiobolus thromboides FSU 785]|nr:mitochondrial carrier [Neoconidiobolus thromboides FSU 785]